LWRGARPQPRPREQEGTAAHRRDTTAARLDRAQPVDQHLVGQRGDGAVATGHDHRVDPGGAISQPGVGRQAETARRREQLTVARDQHDSVGARTKPGGQVEHL
jgi:hypothetical protein